MTHEQIDESIIPVDSQLGRDVAQYVARYFPGSLVAGIQSSFHKGVFIGDYSIHLDVSLMHPSIERVGIGFSHEDLPTRPHSWGELLSLKGIRLYMGSVTIRDVGYDEQPEGRSRTYKADTLYEADIAQWTKQHGDGMLYGCVRRKHVFIITTEAVDRDTVKQLQALDIPEPEPPIEEVQAFDALLGDLDIDL